MHVSDLNNYCLEYFVEYYESIVYQGEVAEVIDFLNDNASNPAVVKDWIIETCFENETISENLLSALINTIDFDWIWDEIWKSEDISEEHKSMTNKKTHNVN